MREGDFGEGLGVVGSFEGLRWLERVLDKELLVLVFVFVFLLYIFIKYFWVFFIVVKVMES